MRATVYSDSCLHSVCTSNHLLSCLSVWMSLLLRVYIYFGLSPQNQRERKREGDTNTQTHSCNSLWQYSFFCYIFKGAEVTFMFCSFSCQISYLELFFAVSLILRIIFGGEHHVVIRTFLIKNHIFILMLCPVLLFGFLPFAIWH